MLTLACVNHHTLNEWTGWRTDFLGLSGVIKTTWRSLTGLVPGTKKPFFLDSLLLCPNWPFRRLSWVVVHLSVSTGRICLDVSDTILLSGVLWCLVFIFLSVGSVAQTKKSTKKKNLILLDRGTSFRHFYVSCCGMVMQVHRLVFGKECHHQPRSLWDSFGRWTF